LLFSSKIPDKGIQQGKTVFFFSSSCNFQWIAAVGQFFCPGKHFAQLDTKLGYSVDADPVI